jgi:SAM-dependent methyltransferase
MPPVLLYCYAALRTLDHMYMSRIKSITAIFIGLILLGIGAVGGAAVMKLKIFPYAIIEPLSEYAHLIFLRVSDPEGYAKRNQRITETAFAETVGEGMIAGNNTYKSELLEAEIDVPEGVFWPQEAEGKMLPLMARNPNLFKGKTVLEIGTGTGIISLMAAKQGATKVVSTDISPEAVAAANANAAKLGYADIMEARLVPLDDMSAFSAMNDGETFDVILSNPPYALDLDAPTNTAVVDNGDLGFSIVRGLETRLNDDGIVIMFYGSLFFHEVMVKFARFSGYDVNNHPPIGLYPWEAETLFNHYLRRLLRAEGLEEDAFRFDYMTDQALSRDYLLNAYLTAQDANFKGGLIPGEKGWRWYPGIMVIRK